MKRRSRIDLTPFVIAFVVLATVSGAMMWVSNACRNPVPERILNEVLHNRAPHLNWHVRVVVTAIGQPVAAMIVDADRHVISRYDPVMHGGLFRAPHNGFDMAEAIAWVEANVRCVERIAIVDQQPRVEIRAR